MTYGFKGLMFLGVLASACVDTLPDGAGEMVDELPWEVLPDDSVVSQSYALSGCSDPMWQPPPEVEVNVIASCAATRGDIAIAVANPPAIYYCPRVVKWVNARFPGMGHFYFVHEYGHILLPSSNERRVDCWAAEQLASTCYVEVAVAHFVSRTDCHPRYGCGADRAERVARCADRGWQYY